jgi:hypothetical protein
VFCSADARRFLRMSVVEYFVSRWGNGCLQYEYSSQAKSCSRYIVMKLKLSRPNGVRSVVPYTSQQVSTKDDSLHPLSWRSDSSKLRVLLGPPLATRDRSPWPLLCPWRGVPPVASGAYRRFTDGLDKSLPNRPHENQIGDPMVDSEGDSRT